VSDGITRRDFLNGALIGVGGAFAAPWLTPDLLRQFESDYPPALTGLRGSHVGSYEAFHALRDGRFWEEAPEVVSTGEEYDLVVVGAGISGLSATWYYRQARPGARILILDNHDDFGGHARRNEFTHQGRTWIGYGGTQSIDSPLPYSATAKALITELGIEVSRWATVHDRALYPGLGLRPAFFFDRETFGQDKLVRGSRREFDDGFIAEAPLTERARADLKRLLADPFDPWPSETEGAKRARLARMSYADFLTKVWGADPLLIPLFTTGTHDLFGVGVDAVPAQDAHGLGFPGFQGLGLGERPGPGQNYDSMPSAEAGEYYFHFPDGNASIARLLVRRLVPGAIPGRTANDVVTARADYARLDRPGSAVRIRLRSPVVRVQHDGPATTATSATVTYATGRDVRSVRTAAVVLACWHTSIPYLCPDLPTAQRQALEFAVKVPMVYTNVFIRNWRAFERLGVSRVTAPGFWHPNLTLDFPVSVGGYTHTRSPDEPVVLHLSKAASQPGLPVREQHREGRIALLRTSFDTIEASIREQVTRILGPGGFDTGRDILGITVNRWPHGYAYQYNSLYDDFWFEGHETPCERARRPFGRIAIANADAGAYSYTDAAIDHAHRAVQDLLRLG
jgi:spermidine dehydrogenase